VRMSSCGAGRKLVVRVATPTQTETCRTNPQVLGILKLAGWDAKYSGRVVPARAGCQALGPDENWSYRLPSAWGRGTRCTGRHVPGVLVRTTPFGSHGGPWSRPSSPVVQTWCLDNELPFEYHVLSCNDRGRSW
jgi:hypothetical protein